MLLEVVAVAMMREATPCSSATIFRSTFRSSAAALARSGAGRWRGNARQRAVGKREGLLDGGQDAARDAGALEAARNGPEPAERFRVARLLQRDLVDRIVLQDAAARHVARLRLALAPGGERLQDGELARLLHAHLQPLPGVLRIGAVGLDVGEDRHLLVDPVGAVLLGELR